MPKVEQLPDTVKDFAFRNGLYVDSGPDFDHHMDRLIHAIDGMLGATRPPEVLRRPGAVKAPPPKQQVMSSAAEGKSFPPPKRKDGQVAKPTVDHTRASNVREITVKQGIVGSTIIAGDGNIVTQTATITHQYDVAADFAEVRKVLEQLQTPDRGKIRRALDDAGEELAKPEANKAEIGSALKRALDYAGKVTNFGKKAVKLAPHIHRLAEYLGSEWSSLMS
jgi:hypothetical protein